MTVILKTSPLKIFLRTRILCSDDKIINFLLQKTFLIIAFVAFEYKYKKKEERTLRKANLSVVEVVLLNLVGVAAVFSFGIRELFISSPPDAMNGLFSFLRISVANLCSLYLLVSQ